MIIKIIPENASRVAALLAGDVDIINELPAHDIRNVEANRNTKVMAVNGTRTFFVALNNTRKPFDDVRVRRAANHALNRQLIIDKLLNGRAEKLNGVISAAAFGFNLDLTEYAYDVKTAKALLAEAAMRRHRRHAGRRWTAEGDRPAIAALLTQPVFAPRWPWERDRRCARNGRRRASVRAKCGSPRGAMAGLTPPTSSSRPCKRAARQFAFYSNAEVDGLLAAGGGTDTAKRAALYQQAQAIVNRDAPWIFLWLPQDLYVSRRGSRAGLRGQRLAEPARCLCPVAWGSAAGDHIRPMTPILLLQRLLI